MPSVGEQETVIQFNRDQQHATIYTSDRMTMTKLDKRCKESPEFYSLERVEHDQEGNVVGKFYKLSNKQLISFRSKKVSRVYTEEQKAVFAARLLNARKNKNIEE